MIKLHGCRAVMCKRRETAYNMNSIVENSCMDDDSFGEESISEGNSVGFWSNVTGAARRQVCSASGLVVTSDFEEDERNVSVGDDKVSQPRSRVLFRWMCCSIFSCESVVVFQVI